jgi:hypothetical protein
MRGTIVNRRATSRRAPYEDMHDHGSIAPPFHHNLLIAVFRAAIMYADEVLLVTRFVPLLS